MHFTISKIARKFGLSRSTLLYYDSIGLLSPIKRNESNYRVYTEKECKELEQICILRSIGVSIEDIKDIINSRISRTNTVLHQRLKAINDEINRLREQQKSIVDLLGKKEIMMSTRIMTKEKWIELLRKAGLDDKGMAKWHYEFEMSSPEAHQDFLESLGLSTEEISRIRNWASKQE